MKRRRVHELYPRPGKSFGRMAAACRCGHPHVRGLARAAPSSRLHNSAPKRLTSALFTARKKIRSLAAQLGAVRRKLAVLEEEDLQRRVNRVTRALTGRAR